ncbi:MAG TPA: hypothetical protein VGD98_26500 [Ktedonobacteraceae bacterium]
MVRVVGVFERTHILFQPKLGQLVIARAKGMALTLIVDLGVQRHAICLSRTGLRLPCKDQPGDSRGRCKNEGQRHETRNDGQPQAFLCRPACWF